MGWRMDVAQRDNIPNMGIVTPGHTFQDVHGRSSLGRIVRWRRKDIEVLNISEVCITPKETKNNTKLDDSMSYEVMGI